MANKLSLEEVNKFLDGMGIAPLGSFRSGSLPAASLNTSSLGGYYDHTGKAIPLSGENLDDLRESAQDLADVGGLEGMTPEYIVEGISTPGQAGVSPTDTADNNRALSIPGEERTNWMQPREKSFSEKRREAFLNTNMGSMKALRAADAATNRFSQGGNYYYKDGDELVQVNKEAYRKGQHVQLSPEEIKAAYLTPIKATMVPDDPIVDYSFDAPEEQMAPGAISSPGWSWADLEDE